MKNTIFASIGRMGRINSKKFSFVFILNILNIDAKNPLHSFVIPDSIGTVALRGIRY